MAVCICDLACLPPVCPGMACCPWQMGATRNHCCSGQEPGDVYLRPILSAFQQSLWVCWHISRASPVHLEAVHLWAVEALRFCCSGARGQPWQGRAGCRAVALLAAGPVADFWCISLKKSHGFMSGMKTNPSMTTLSPERIFPHIPPRVAALRWLVWESLSSCPLQAPGLKQVETVPTPVLCLCSSWEVARPLLPGSSGAS